MQTNTRKLTRIAMLSAIAYVVMLVARFPVVMFLKYEPKDVVITLGGLLWGPMTSVAVSVIVSFLEMFSVSETGILGCVMNIVSSCSFACTEALVYKKHRSLKGALAGLALGSAVMVALMMLWNYLITPLYMGYPREAVVQLLLPAFLPFNLLKAGLNAGITFFLYKPVSDALRKSGLLERPGHTAAAKSRPTGLYLFFGFLLVSCVLLVLVMNGVI